MSKRFRIEIMLHKIPLILHRITNPRYGESTIEQRLSSCQVIRLYMKLNTSLVELLMTQTDPQETELLGRTFLGNFQVCVMLELVASISTLPNNTPTTSCSIVYSFYRKLDNSNLFLSTKITTHIPCP